MTARGGAGARTDHPVRRDDGRVSIFLAIAMIGVLAVIGLSFDGAGQLRTMQRADNLAAEAARAGGQAIDLATAIEGGPKEIDEAQARVAVQRYLAAAGGVRSHSVSFPVVGGQKLIRVRITLVYDTYLLGALPGFTNTITVQGEATARAITGR
jgi:hypothetical protein